MIFASKVEMYPKEEVVMLPHLGKTRLRKVSYERMIHLINDENYGIEHEPHLSNEYYRVYRAKNGSLYVVPENEEDDTIGN